MIMPIIHYPWLAHNRMTGIGAAKYLDVPVKFCYYMAMISPLENERLAHDIYGWF